MAVDGRSCHSWNHEGDTTVSHRVADGLLVVNGDVVEDASCGHWDRALDADGGQSGDGGVDAVSRAQSDRVVVGDHAAHDLSIHGHVVVQDAVG